MSLTAFQRYRRMHQVEEMKPENIKATEEKSKEAENFTDAPLVPDEPEVKEDTLVPEVTEEKENKTTTRRNTRKK